MNKYRGSRLIKVGIIGVVLAVLINIVGLSPDRLVAWATDVRYRAIFLDAGGLVEGNDVMISGTKVGSVRKISLEHGKVAVQFQVKSTAVLLSDTTAHIKTGSLLGKRILTLVPAGSGPLPPRSTIPVSRTSSPYALTDAVSELTTNISATDTTQLNQSLDTLAATLDQISPQLGPMFDGLSRMSRMLNERNRSLGDLLSTANSVTKVLSDRSQQVNTMILNANSLLGVLVERRQAIVDLLVNTKALAAQLSVLIHDNEKQLGPTLGHLNSVLAMLENNRDNISKAIPGLAQSSQTTGEAVSSGAYYNAFISNLPQGQFLKPLLDSAFGIQPRGMFPFPTCGPDGDCHERKEQPADHLPVAPR